MMSALPLTSTRFRKLKILCVINLLDGDLCKKIISIFFWFSNMILSDALILSASQLQT